MSLSAKEGVTCKEVPPGSFPHGRNLLREFTVPQDGDD